MKIKFEHKVVNYISLWDFESNEVWSIVPHEELIILVPSFTTSIIKINRKTVSTSIKTSALKALQS